MDGLLHDLTRLGVVLFSHDSKNRCRRLSLHSYECWCLLVFSYD